MFTALKRPQVPVLATMLILGVGAAWLGVRSSDAHAQSAAPTERAGWPAPGVVGCDNWAAWEDHQPFQRPRLIVTADCILPTPGHRVELRPHNPQGINPRILLLDLVMHAPKGPAPDVLTPFRLRYEQPAGRYDSVTILPDGVTIDVQRTW